MLFTRQRDQQFILGGFVKEQLLLMNYSPA